MTHDKKLRQRAAILKEGVTASRKARNYRNNATVSQTETIASVEQNCRTDATPTLSDPSDQYPAHARGGGVKPQRENHLGNGGALLEVGLGKVEFHSWFREVTLERIDQEELTLSAPTRFQRDWIENHFTEAILHAWRGAGSPVQRLRIVVRP